MSHVSPKDEARAAFGDAAKSAAIHLKNGSTLATSKGSSAGSGGCESYNEESRMHSTLTYRSLVFAGLHGCSVVTTALSVIRLVLSKNAQASSLHESPSSSSLSTAAPPLVSMETARALLLPLVAGIAIPTSLSLSYLIWSAARCERYFEARERDRERWEMQNFPEGEHAEMVNLYQSQGLSEEDATEVVRIFSKDDTVFLNLMMVEELGYSRFPMPTAAQTFWRGSVPAALSHGLCTIVPILPFLLVRHAPLPTAEVVLVVQALLLSGLQARLLHGAYADAKSAIPVIGGNAAWLAALYIATRVTGQLCLSWMK